MRKFSSHELQTQRSAQHAPHEHAIMSQLRFEEAISAHQDAAAIFRETGDRHGEGQALNNLGLALPLVRRFEEAISALQDAAAIFRETGDRHSEGITLNNVESVRAAQSRRERQTIRHSHRRL